MKKKDKIPVELNQDYYLDLDSNCVYFALKGWAKDITAFVSADKWELVRKYDWYMGKDGYPFTHHFSRIKLHRFVYKIILRESIPQGMCIDHIDRNKLNNTNQNLRLATPQENSFNKSSKGKTKGVRKVSEGNYSAIAIKNGIRHQIKNIPTEEAAALTYNLMAEELFGEFAALNII